MTDWIRVVDKAAPDIAHLPPNVVGALGGTGHLVYCARCLGKVHAASWRSNAEVLAIVTVFRHQHARCA